MNNSTLATTARETISDFWTAEHVRRLVAPLGLLEHEIDELVIIANRDTFGAAMERACRMRPLDFPAPHKLQRHRPPLLTGQTIPVADIHQYFALYELRLDIEEAMIAFQIAQFPWFLSEMQRLRAVDPQESDASLISTLRRRRPMDCPSEEVFAHRKWITACREDLDRLRNTLHTTPPPVVWGMPGDMPSRALLYPLQAEPAPRCAPTPSLPSPGFSAAAAATIPTPANPSPSPDDVASPEAPRPSESPRSGDTAAALRRALAFVLRGPSPACPSSAQTESTPAAPGRPT